MSVSVLSVAKEFCERSDWALTNLELQKMTYLAHMRYMGENDEAPLVIGLYEAWNLGPVHPDLYKVLKVFGGNPVEPPPLQSYPSLPEETDIGGFVHKIFGRLPRTRLVSITHQKGGAWHRNYRRGQRGIKIPNADILEEYRENGHAARATAG